MKLNIKRLKIIYLLFLIGFFVIAMRLFQLQIKDYALIKTQADNLIVRTIPIKARRGKIIDSKGDILAYSTDIKKLVYKAEIAEDYIKKRKEAAEKSGTALSYPTTVEECVDNDLKILAEIYGDFDAEEVKAEIMKLVNDKESKLPSKRVVVIDDFPKQYQQVFNERIYAEEKKQRFVAIVMEDAIKRVYPNTRLASHILGYTDLDGHGQSGIEISMEKELAGIEGTVKARTDKYGRKMAQHEAETVETPVQHGYTVQLTLDSTIQFITEEALASAYKVTKPLKIMAIVQDSRNGDILAMANYPDFDPNNKTQAICDIQIQEMANKTEGQTDIDIMQKYWINHCVQSLYIPGSAFKILVGMMGLEEGVTYNDKPHYCPGFKEVDGMTIKCWKHSGHGPQNLIQGFQNSCNIVFMDTIQNVGKQRTYDYIKAFQLDRKSGIKLNGEAIPLLISLDKLQNVDLARIGFGHGISMTPLQMMNILSVVGDEGKLHQPRIVKALYDQDGNEVEEFLPRDEGQIISKAVADNVLSILESVVTKGSGKAVNIPGYRIAGKTGTAVKPNPETGQFDNDRRVYASFAAVVPADNPRFNLLVIVDEPKTKNVHGSSVAAPIAREIIEKTLQHLNIESDQNLQYEMTVVPQFVGISLAEASVLAENNALTLLSVDGREITELDQAAIISKQYPENGSLLAAGSTIYVEIGN